MIDEIISEFRDLPLEIQDKLSSSEILEVLKDVEKQYPQRQVSLAEILMRIAIKEIDINNLTGTLEKEYFLDRETARGISIVLKEKIPWPTLGFEIKEKELLEEKAESKYLQLPEKIRNVIFAPENTAIFNQLAEKYNFDINTVITRLAAKDITFDDLDKILVANYHLPISALKDVEENLTKILKPIIQMLETKKTEELKPEALEQEIEKLKESIPTMAPKISYNEAVDNAIKKIGLSFTDESIANRFKHIALSFLNETRGDLEMRIVLKRPQDIGGMGCAEEVADKIIEALEAEKPRIKVEIKKEIPKPELAEGLAMPHEMIPTMTRIQPAAPPPPTFAKATEGRKATEGKPDLSAEVSPSETKAETKPSVLEEKIPTQPLEITPAVEPKKEEPIVEEKPIVPPEAPLTPVELKEEIIGPEEITKVAEEILAETPIIEAPKESEFETEKAVPEPVKPEYPSTRVPETFISIHRPPSEPSRLTMEEIKVTPKIYGPIDELRSIKIEDWKRWGTPNEASQRIQDKINLLGDESLVKKAEGIKAWKESEVNQMYLDIGSESIDKGISVEEVIAMRTKEGRPTLNRDEFDAVVELNQKLRF